MRQKAVSDPYSFTIAGAARHYGIGATNLRELIKNGILKPSRPLSPIRKGKKWTKILIRRDDIQKLIDDNVLDVPNLAHI